MEPIELRNREHLGFIQALTDLVAKPFKKKSTDPIELLPPKVVNRIFGFFEGFDLLNFSLVSRRWYRFIAKSTACMDKLKIVIAEPRIGCFQLFTMKDAILLTQQGRKYRHISLTALERQFLFQHRLLLVSFPWHTVTLNNHTFNSKMDFINFLGMIEPFVEDLTLRGVKYGRSHINICTTSFTFPYLYRLSIINCYTYIYTEPFKHATTLRCFNLATDALPNHSEYVNDELTERVRAIQLMLLNNIHINYLEMFIHQRDFDAMFMDQRFLSRIQFNLQSLYVGKFKQQDNDGINVVQVNNFVDFLKSQEGTLALLYFDNWLGNAALEYVINDMQLRDLTIANLEPLGIHDESIANLNLFSNDTIEHLTLWSHSAKHHAVAEEIVKVCRGLRVLEIRTINQPILEAIIENNDYIQIIICDFFSAYIPPQRDVMKYLTTMIINVNCADNFRDLIRIKDCYTKFEVIFLKAAKNLKRRWNISNMNFYRY